MKFSLSLKVVVLFAAIFVGIVAVGFIAMQNSVAFSNTTREIESSNKILDEAEKVLGLDNEKEAAIRDYVLSGDSSFLALPAVAQERIYGHIDKLKVLTRQDSFQRRDAELLAHYSRVEGNLFDSAVALRNRNDISAAIALISGAEWKLRTGGIDRLISSIELKESDDLRQHEQGQAAKIYALNQMLWLLVGIPLALLFVLFYAINQALFVRKRAEQSVRALNESLELKVKERTGQLEESNRELESFGYSVSHDLRAPLRIINGYGRLLARSTTNKLDEEEKDILHTIMESADRMGHLIDDLLSFSRLGRASLSKRDVSMDDMVKVVIEELKTNSRPAAEITVHKLPQTNCDPSLTKQVWTNLISNALKYSGKCARPRIEIGTQAQNGSLTYYVKDNGAGFDMKYMSKLFCVFQRLHSSSDYEGTGVGLALAQRIVSKHGGRIWAEGRVNEGATFYFTLPN